MSVYHSFHSTSTSIINIALPYEYSKSLTSGESVRGNGMLAKGVVYIFNVADVLSKPLQGRLFHTIKQYLLGMDH